MCVCVSMTKGGLFGIGVMRECLFSQMAITKVARFTNLAGIGPNY